MSGRSQVRSYDGIQFVIGTYRLIAPAALAALELSFGWFSGTAR